MSRKKGLTASLEDYLEAIAVLSERNEKVRVTDISDELEVKKSSTHTALSKLKERGLIIHEKYKDVKLTASGEVEAEKVRKIHSIMYTFLSEFLALPGNICENDACKIEHVVSSETLERLSAFLDYISLRESFDSGLWRENFLKFCATGEMEKHKEVH